MTGRVTNGALSEASIELPASGGADRQLVKWKQPSRCPGAADGLPEAGATHAVFAGGSTVRRLAKIARRPILDVCPHRAAGAKLSTTLNRHRDPAAGDLKKLLFHDNY